MNASVKPVRLQLSRKKGFDLRTHSLAANGLLAVNVARPSAWGNFAAKRLGLTTGALAVDAFRRWVEDEASDAWKSRVPRELRGRNLACWCSASCACHADVLLELANGPVCDAVSSLAAEGERA